MPAHRLFYVIFFLETSGAFLIAIAIFAAIEVTSEVMQFFVVLMAFSITIVWPENGAISL